MTFRTAPGASPAIAALILIAISPGALADGPAIRAATRCVNQPSCGADIHLREAKANYEKEGKARLAAYRATPSKPEEQPLAPMLEGHGCDVASSVGGYYFWAPAGELPEGHAAVEELLSRVQSGSVKDGAAFVEAAESTRKEKHYAFCDVVAVQNASGPPHDCVTVVIVTPTERWVRAGYGEMICVTGSRIRATGAIDVSFDVSSTMSIEALGDSVLQTLEKSFGLSVNRELESAKDGSLEALHLLGAGSLRDSAILKDWREAIDFDVDIWPDEDGHISVRGTAHAMVSRRAAGNVADYRGLTDAQRSKYAAAFDRGIETAITTVGVKCKKQDASRIQCH